MKNVVFWGVTPCRYDTALRFGKNILTPFSGLKGKQSKTPAEVNDKLNLAYSSILKMEMLQARRQ
jgi:hypothetical protein